MPAHSHATGAAASDAPAWPAPPHVMPTQVGIHAFARTGTPIGATA
jgi:hypothetical protein